MAVCCENYSKNTNNSEKMAYFLILKHIHLVTSGLENYFQHQNAEVIIFLNDGPFYLVDM